MKIDRVIKMFLPPRCPLCGKVIYYDQLCCPICSSTIKCISPPVCSFCGFEKESCGCSKKTHLYHSVVSPFYYEDAVKRGISRLKYSDKPAIEQFFASRMYEVFLREYQHLHLDYITCVPMHPDKLKERGYNPPERIARRLAVLLDIPYRECLVKLYESKEQHTLQKESRKGNVLGVYEPYKNLKLDGASVLLCDDVITTGATLDECAKMLRLAGAKNVFCITAAATPLKKIHRTDKKA